MATESSLPWLLGTMWGWYQWNMSFYGHAQGHVSGPEVLGEPPAPPMARSITATAPENICYGFFYSHSEIIPRGTNTPSVGPLPTASHPRLRTQVGYLGAGSPGAGHRCAGTDKYPNSCQVSRSPEWFQDSTVTGWTLI